MDWQHLNSPVIADFVSPAERADILQLRVLCAIVPFISLSTQWSHSATRHVQTFIITQRYNRRDRNRPTNNSVTEKTEEPRPAVFIDKKPRRFPGAISVGRSAQCNLIQRICAGVTADT